MLILDRYDRLLDFSGGRIWERQLFYETVSTPRRCYPFPFQGALYPWENARTDRALIKTSLRADAPGPHLPFFCASCNSAGLRKIICMNRKIMHLYRLAFPCSGAFYHSFPQDYTAKSQLIPSTKLSCFRIIKETNELKRTIILFELCRKYSICTDWRSFISRRRTLKRTGR